MESDSDFMQSSLDEDFDANFTKFDGNLDKLTDSEFLSGGEKKKGKVEDWESQNQQVAASGDIGRLFSLSLSKSRGSGDSEDSSFLGMPRANAKTAEF